MRVVQTIMDKQGVSTEMIRFIDHPVAPGVDTDMTKHGWPADAWPDLWPRIKNADILVVGTPIWLGEESSACRVLIERLYAHGGDTNDKGQYVFYGKTGGCVVTGNEDGIKHCGQTVLFALQHLGYTIPPQAETGWVGPAGPGKSYLDDGSGGPDNDFTQRKATFLAWNLMHMARMLKDAGGFPAWGNSPEAWRQGERFGHPDGD